MKREKYINWDQYFMAFAILASKRSKDPNTQVGCCIVSDDKRIISTGYNGLPHGCSDDDFPWINDKESGWINTKYPYVCHAEANAIISCYSRCIKGATIYVNLFPCNECAKLIIQAGIKEVVYYSDKYAHLDDTKASKKLFTATGIKLTQYKETNEKIEINI